jgi:flagellar FliL protein
MQNIINLIIVRKTKEDLKTINDQLDLREEIKAHINHILTNGKIKEVYFREFIVN